MQSTAEEVAFWERTRHIPDQQVLFHQGAGGPMNGNLYDGGVQPFYENKPQLSGLRKSLVLTLL